MRFGETLPERVLAAISITMVAAFAIGARGSPCFDGMPDLSARMILTGWSLSGGDLQVTHFLATHIMQAVPLAALLVAYAQPGRLHLPLVIGMATLWSLWTLTEFRAALSGEAAIILTPFL